MVAHGISLLRLFVLYWFFRLNNALGMLFQGFDEDEITYTTPNSQWEVLHTFESGREIEIDVVIVYYHWVSVRRNLSHIRPLHHPNVPKRWETRACKNGQ